VLVAFAAALAREAGALTPAEPKISAVRWHLIGKVIFWLAVDPRTRPS
jgi:hypothetical protein